MNLEPDEWRYYADAMSLALRFSLERSYLGAPTDQLRSRLQHVAGLSDNSGQPTVWLRLDQIGDTPEAGTMDPAIALQVALGACHRPGASRLLFLVSGDGEQHNVFVGLRSLDAMIRSTDLAFPAKAFIEANWPATRLVHCTGAGDPEQLIQKAISDYGGRHSLTGVPALLDRERPRHTQSLDLLIEGLRGRKYLYLVIAEPLAMRSQATIISQARDLLGALSAFSKANVTFSDGQTVGVSFANSASVAETRGHTTSTGDARSYPTLASMLKYVGLFGGAALAPLSVPLALGTGLGGIIASMLPQSRNYTRGQSTTSSSTRTEGSTTTSSASSQSGRAMAREYINAHVQAVEAQIRRLIERIDSQKVWEVGAYLLTEYEEEGQDAGAQLSALLNGTRRHGEEPIRFQSLSHFWRKRVERDLLEHRQPRFAIVSETGGEPLAHPLGAPFEGLSTPLNAEELSLLVSFPRREVPGVKVRPFASFAVNPQEVEAPSVVLGEILRGETPIGTKMKIALNSFTKNVLITGSTGSGKSVTTRTLLRQLHDAGIPFLVIEPAKDEYVQWARSINAALPADSPRRIRIFKPGAAPRTLGKDHEELRLNPFAVVSPNQVILHIERLKALLTLSLPMQESLPLLLEDVLYAIYARNGWFNSSHLAKTRPYPPTIADVLKSRSNNLKGPKKASTPGPLRLKAPPQLFLEDCVKAKGYERTVAANLGAALRTRFEALTVGWKGDVFNCVRSTRPDTLFGAPAVVNLSFLGDDFSRSLTAGLLMGLLHEWRQFLQESADSFTSPGLRHLVVLEEAHCVLEPVRHVAATAMDPKGMVSRMFAELLSEMRAWGQGFMLVDQYPTRLILDAIKNTNLKIVHRLPSRDDQEIVAAAMSLGPAQIKLIPHLLPGQAIVLGDCDDAPFRVSVARKEASQS